MEYRAEATTLEGFVEQLAVRYLCRGYRFYHQDSSPQAKTRGPSMPSSSHATGSRPQNSRGLVARLGAWPTCSYSASDGTWC